jgi:dienelactone hydrolase
MKALSCISCGALLLVSLSSIRGLQADELVQVAAQRATIGLDHSDQPLFGYLARPEGHGPFPAVILLHWCLGSGLHDIATAAKLKSWGYVALALDSLGDANRCQQGGDGYGAEAVDAYAALNYLGALAFVERNRVAVMGYSMGATAVLDATEQGSIERSQPMHFRAAVAYYPTCGGSSGIMTVPTLILIGEHDDWTPADYCRKMAAQESDIGKVRAKGVSQPINLIVYPGATHAFDLPMSPMRYMGHLVTYNEAAAKDAGEHLRVFLREMLGAPSSGTSTGTIAPK